MLKVTHMLKWLEGLRPCNGVHSLLSAPSGQMWFCSFHTGLWFPIEGISSFCLVTQPFSWVTVFVHPFPGPKCSKLKVKNVFNRNKNTSAFSRALPLPEFSSACSPLLLLGLTILRMGLYAPFCRTRRGTQSRLCLFRVSQRPPCLESFPHSFPSCSELPA